PYRTGATYNGITATPHQGDPMHPAATVNAATPQSNWTNDGTVAHVIRPVFARALRFQGAGGIVFATIVHHPGNVGSHWWSDPVSFWPDRVREALSSSWDG